jgi:hypothetical protein
MTQNPDSHGFAIGQPENPSAGVFFQQTKRRQTLDDVTKFTDEQINEIAAKRAVAPAPRVDDSQSLEQIAQTLVDLHQSMLDAGQKYDNRFDQAAIDQARKTDLLSLIADLRRQLLPLEDDLAAIENKPNPLQSYRKSAELAGRDLAASARYLKAWMLENLAAKEYKLSFRELPHPLQDVLLKRTGKQLDRFTNRFERLHTTSESLCGAERIDAAMSRVEQSITALQNIIEGLE